MSRALMAGVATLAAFSPVQAQEPGSNQVTMYANGHFKRPGPTLDGPTRLYTPFTMKSVKIPPGAVWEFCSGNTYTGCKEFGQSVESMVMNVRSARPVASVIPSTATAGGGATVGATGAGASLRGMASEYFVAPDQNGNRVSVSPGTSEAMTRAAHEFCRVKGWNESAYARLQSINGQFYLADVLCVKN
jgi:hypothetical protein